MTNQTKTRDSFIFYRSFFDSTIPLNKEQKAELFDAICYYAFDEILIDLGGIPKAMFSLVKPQLDANRRKWKNGCKEKKEAKDKQEISKTEAKPKQNRSKTEGNVNVNVNVNDNVNEEFDTFWESYKSIHVSKGNKEKSRKLFVKILGTEDINQITEGLKKYMNHCHSKNSYTKSVEVWLKNQGWKDEYESQSKSNNDVTSQANNLLGIDLIVKIETIGSSAKLYFKNKSDFELARNHSRREEMKSLISQSLSTNKFDFSF